MPVTPRRVALLLVAVALLVPVVAAAGGWYLLIPPVVEERGEKHANRDAPLSSWRQHSAHATVKECETARRQWDDDFLKDSLDMYQRSPADTKVYLSVLIEARCIATDDPRLK